MRRALLGRAPGGSSVSGVSGVSGVVACVAVCVSVLLVGCAPAEPDELAVTWDGDGCVYDESSSTVAADLLVTGLGTAEVTVTATADEDTTVPVGSMTRTVTGEGDGGAQTVEVAFTVTGPPFIDADGVAACALEVEE